MEAAAKRVLDLQSETAPTETVKKSLLVKQDHRETKVHCYMHFCWVACLPQDNEN